MEDKQCASKTEESVAYCSTNGGNLKWQNIENWAEQLTREKLY